MRQLTQKLKDGSMKVSEVPVPQVGSGTVLVSNHYSLVSAGTEGSTVRAARKGYIGKAKERPRQVKQVMDTLKTQGPVQTYRAVMRKLDAYSPLGYSCAGQVIDVADDVQEFRVGDLVACGGLSACHAEVVSVPVNLCVKLKPDADLKQAAYNTLGAISLQAIRQADLKLGETCCVIGLGLLGQLTSILLRASGVRTVGIDVSPEPVELASQYCSDLALVRSENGISERIQNFTDGLGCDGVIIAASTDSLDPINFAGAISRKRGTVVILGAVPTGFDREPYFYKKELEVKMSCSYGPGRYDPIYEEKGLDYPAAYVRWSEKRNMGAFQELVYTKKIDVSYLTTHVFKLADAPSAYEMMLAKSEPFIGILFEYDPQITRIKRRRVEIRAQPSAISHRPSTIGIGFLGAGSYAQSHLLPNIPKNKDVVLKGVMTASSTGSRSAGERFGFEFCTTDIADIVDNDEIDAVFIATRHNTHAEYVMRALKAGKHVFVEKPLCLSVEELDEISQMYKSQLSTGDAQPGLMVGYNRRFSPLLAEIRESIGEGPIAALYRVNSGPIPADHWYQDPEVGGGRIIGEFCHFVDALTFLTRSSPVSLYAAAIPDPHDFCDNVTASLRYANGSIGTISYLSNGDKSLRKERLEVFGHGATAVLDDFRSLFVHYKGRKKKRTLVVQNKGQKNEIKAFLNSVSAGEKLPISFYELYMASLVTFKVLESIRKGESVRIDVSPE